MAATSYDLHFRLVDGIKVPSPGYGGMSLSNMYGTANDEDSKALLRRAIKIGLTFWDTADVYGSGHNEELIGSVLAEGDNRAKVFLATKFSRELDPVTNKPTGRIRGDAAYIRQAIEASIKRLGTTPDLYNQHRVDPNASLEETYGTLEELRKEGKFKYIGISEPNAETLRKAAKIAKISALQEEYSLWTTDIERNGILQTTRELGIPIVAYSPLGRGFLTGEVKSSEDIEPIDIRRRFPRFTQENIDNNMEIVEKLDAIATKKGITSAQLALAWVGSQGEDIIPIFGTKSFTRLEENWASRDVVLTEELKELRKVVDGFEVRGERYPEGIAKYIGN
ncbi:oxidoreductase [Fomitiporia mediterranea MF3/22]|uniref:oxidoreductase n=1 Tax=Fomitiporia mediterranea (strain MF3/22) TaxID=694068 RepID=UPI0004407790|nr:oxidoreductase [Fomitiporia mediterranea MF3/22]EJC99318.1 oxidoreductase [Fomitiporia mediterranea MF3/22]